MLQLTQGQSACRVIHIFVSFSAVLKHESHHDSALARFLLRRALKNKKIGHSFFWHLKAELHLTQVAQRFVLLLEAYLRGCDDHRQELSKQNNLVSPSILRRSNSERTKRWLPLPKKSKPYLALRDSKLYVKHFRRHRCPRGFSCRWTPAWKVKALS